MAEGKQRFPWLSPGDRLVVVVVFVSLVGLLGMHHALRAGLGAPRAELISGPRLENHRIDINKAEWWELQALRGIGEKRAKEIDAHRRRNGDFSSVDALTRVRGIGKKTVERLRPYLTASRQEETNEEER